MIISELKDGTLEALCFATPRGFGVMLNEPMPCKGCGAMHFWFENAGGKTLCVGCPKGELNEQKD